MDLNILIALKNYIVFSILRFDYLFDDDDIESYGSYLTDEDEFRFADEPDLTDNDEEFRSWH